MVATAINDGATGGVVQHDAAAKEEENHIASLMERIEQCIQDDNEKHQSPDDLASYWQRNVGSEDAIAVYKSMLADSGQLNRILVARKYDLNLSANLFLEQVRFRVKWRPLEITPDSIPNALPSGAWRLCGYSKEGCIISNYKLEYWNPSEYGVAELAAQEDNDAIDEYTRYIVYMIELMIGSMKAPPVPQQFCVLFDLTGFSVSLVFNSNVRLMIRKLIYIAQSQYPERLRKVFLVNAPYGFSTAWKLIRPLLDEKTASKVHFCSLDQIAQDIDTSVLSQEYGGTHEEYPVPSKTIQEELSRDK